MIYSGLNTVIQFICAIYVTIVFDSTLFRRFWAPDYYLILQKQIKSFKLPLTKNLNQWLTDQIKYRNTIFQEHSRKRGTIFLYAALIVLVSIAVCESNQNDLTFSFIVLLFCSYIILLIMPAFLNRWIWLILALFLESCFFCCSIYWPIITFNPTGYIYKIRLAIIVLLSSPIFYQIVKSWCYSTAIKCFVVHELTNISKEYSQACKAIKNQDKTLIPASYQPIFSRMAFDQPDGNIQLTQINQHVVSVLQLRFNNIPITHLLKAYWKNPEVEQLKGEDTLQDETQTVSEVKETPNLSSSTPNEYEKLGNKKVRNNENTFLPAKQIIKENNQTNLSTDLNKIASAFIEYENSSNKIKNIEEFCKMKGLNKKTFRDYRKSKLKSSSLPKKKNN